MARCQLEPVHVLTPYLDTFIPSRFTSSNCSLASSYFGRRTYPCISYFTILPICPARSAPSCDRCVNVRIEIRITDWSFVYAVLLVSVRFKSRSSSAFCSQASFAASAKLRKATISFVMSVRLSVCLSIRMQQLGDHWTDFCGIWYVSIFRKSVEIIQFHSCLIRMAGTLH
jgi:hypothetical protein